MDGSLFKVGTPPPYNLNIAQKLLAGYTHTTDIWQISRNIQSSQLSEQFFYNRNMVEPKNNIKTVEKFKYYLKIKY